MTGLSIDPENKTTLNLMFPSAAQGAVAVASKENNLELKKILKSISCQNTFHCVDQERKFLKLMDGGCSMPISSFAYIEEKKLKFKVFTVLANRYNLENILEKVSLESDNLLCQAVLS